jgi:hypothetical protein
VSTVAAADIADVSPRRYRRLTRYAVLAPIHLVLLLAVLLLGIWQLYAVSLLVWLFFVWAAGQYQADLNFNPALDEAARARWRITLWLVPWTITVYWALHVRGRRALT